MNKETSDYRKGQFGKLGTEKSEYLPTIKLSSSFGDTNYMDISIDELKRIKYLLTHKNVVVVGETV